MEREHINRARFERWLRKNIGSFSVDGETGNVYQYKILLGTKPSYTNMEFSIADYGVDGISICYFDTYRGKNQCFQHIYRWSDAYWMLIYGLAFPGQIEAADAGETASVINRVVGRTPYDFQWEPQNTLVDIGDELLAAAVELVKYGYISDLHCGEVEGCVTITGKTNICKAAELQDIVEEIRNADISGDDSTEEVWCPWANTASLTIWCNDIRCAYGKCLLALCGYIAFAASNGTLPGLLRERERIRAAYRTSCGPYSFTWQPEDGLRFLEESRFRLAVQMAENGLVSVDKTLSEDNIVSIRSLPGICVGDGSGLDQEKPSCYWAGVAEERKFQDISPDQCVWWSKVDGPLNTSLNYDYCRNCHMHNGCIFFYAGYIQYLKDCGMEERIEEDRKWYHQNERDIETERKEVFSFELPNDLFLDTPEELFEVAELLQERNYVSLLTGAEKEYEEDPENTLVSIRTIRGVMGIDDIVQLRQRILEGTLNRAETDICTATTYDFENTEFPRKKHVVLAGYIDYLRRTGQYRQYRERVTECRRKAEEAFDKLKKDIPELGKVVAIAENEKESSLYCVVEGDRGSGKRAIVEKIAQLLAQKGKIKDSCYDCMTFETLASKLSYLKYESFGEDNTQAYTYAKFKEFEQKKLYVLTDLKEFLEESKTAKESDRSRASHLIKLLGRYQPNTYIIVIGEKRYVERFLDLSPKIQFLFGSNVISLENPQPEELYERFCGRLSGRLRTELENRPEFREEFLKYILMNRRLMPLTNQELADYLADYANNQKMLALPSNNKLPAKELLKSVIGMKNVKKTVEEFEKYALFVKRAEMNGMKLPQSNMHMIFTGNPGTGKTMVARIIAQILFDLGIVAENKLYEVERKDLVGGYTGQTAIKTGDAIEKAMGGVLFVDEAYSLASGDSFGDEAVATLIKAMEDHKDKLVVIFAGYEKEMHDFLSINPGITSRIGYTFHFDDYTTEELKEIFDVKMKKAGFEYGQDVLDAVQDLCSEFIRKRNFGNGRFVDKVVQKVMLKHSSRGGEDIRQIALEDIPSVEEMASTDVIERRDFEEQLRNFIGMENVKDKVRQFAQYVRFRQAAKAGGAVIPDGNMHMIFTGNPGTGKTTIARIMVDMLYEIGILKEHKFKEVERKDLVAEYTGQTATKTAKIIEEAMGGILFVDEAYALADNNFGAEAIATLIKAMEDHKDDLIVIFAGYKDEMRQFLDINPGIASRIGYTFDFENYTPDELVAMYCLKMEKANFRVSEKALKKVKILFTYFSRKKHFGNGRFVGKLQQETFMQHSRNILPDGSNLLYIDEQDIPEIADLNNTAKSTEKSADLDNIIGMQSVKEQVRALEKLVNFQVMAREHGLTVPSTNLHMIFTGNPGTGKTTIARIIAQKLYDIGVIKENKLKETERKDLISEHIGGTAQKTAKVIEDAMGGVLFVDEAYALTPHSPQDFGSEAIATLIKAMEDHKEDLVVIFAGYKDEMRSFEEANPGIASRIGFHIHFPDYTAAELREIFVRKMQSNGFTVTQAAQDKAEKLMQYFCNVKNFGNGRFADKVMQNTLSLHAKNYRADALEIIDEKDIPEIMDMAATMPDADRMVDPQDFSQEERRRIAIHEIGHALLQSRLFPAVPIRRITINAEGNGTYGYIEHRNSMGKQNTKSVYQNNIAVSMAGLAAETVFLGDYADGGSSDIQTASQNARIMITQCGMSRHGFIGSRNEADISREINELLKEGFDTAAGIIEANKTALDGAIEYLVANGNITEQMFKTFLTQ